MTTHQFNIMAENFARYAYQLTSYKARGPWDDKPKPRNGYLRGIGMGANSGLVIIDSYGRSYAIPYADVTLPKISNK